jgi:hypothetical protein
MDDFLKRLLDANPRGKRGSKCWATPGCNQGATFKIHGMPMRLRLSDNQVKHLLQLPPHAIIGSEEAWSLMCTHHAIEIVEHEKRLGNFLYLEELE